MRRLIMWLCFAACALATTSFVAVAVVCASGSLYMATDGSSGWNVDWDARYVTDVPRRGLLLHVPAMAMNDCSRDDIRCVFIDEKFDLKAFAIRKGEVGDTYRVAHWTFKIEQKTTRNHAGELTWVSFKDDDRGGYNGRFLYDGDRGIVSITQERDDKSTKTLVLIDGPGLLAPGLVCPAARN